MGTERTRQVEVTLVVAVPILHAGGLEVMVACLLMDDKDIRQLSKRPSSPIQGCTACSK